MNQELLKRQAEMYRGHEDIADRWAEACRFFESDLRSGWVRLLMEMSALGLSNPAVAAEVRKINAPWRALLEGVAREALEHFGFTTLTAEEVGTYVGCFWRGMELDIMLGVPESEGHHRGSLAAFGRFLSWLEAARNTEPGGSRCGHVVRTVKESFPPPVSRSPGRSTGRASLPCSSSRPG